MKIKPLIILFVVGGSIIGLTILSIISFQDPKPEFDSSDVLGFRKAKNQVLRSKVGAPFYNQKDFDSLRYYPVNERERYSSEFYTIKNGEAVDLMPDRPGYASHIISGYVILEKETWRDTLFVLKDLEEQSDTSFFVPFSDPTNSKQTYGGGRYLDLVVKRGKPVMLDFNYAYNPYCAYNIEYVCAKIPTFNRLSKAIEAGEKTF